MTSGEGRQGAPPALRAAIARATRSSPASAGPHFASAFSSIEPAVCAPAGDGDDVCVAQAKAPMSPDEEPEGPPGSGRREPPRAPPARRRTPRSGPPHRSPRAASPQG